MVLQDIVQLEGHIQTIYLAVYDDKLLLLDGCCRSDVPMVLGYIKQTLKRPITDLKVVVVTHMHPDHAGGAIAFKKATGCLIVSSRKNTQWYSGMNGRIMQGVDILMAHYVATRLNKQIKYLGYPRYLTPDVAVVDGDTLPYFDDWQVFETPGHTDRDLSIYHPDTGQIYTADLIIKLRHKYVTPIPIYIPRIYQSSLAKVKAINPKQVMMAHGGAHYIEPEVFDDLIKRTPKVPKTFKSSINHKLFWWFQTKQSVDDHSEPT